MGLAHSQQTPLEGNHVIHGVMFNNAADRQTWANEQSGNPANAGPPTVALVGKVAVQLDNTSFWVLQGVSPITWAPITPEQPAVDSRYLAVSANRNNVATGIYLRENNNIPTNITPLVLPFNATLIAMTASAAAAFSWTAEVHLGGSLVVGALLNVVAAQTAFRNDLSIAFAAGSGLQLFMNGSGIDRPRISALFRRSD